MGRCRKARSDRSPLLSASFHWVYPFQRTSNTCNKHSLSSSQAGRPCHFSIPVVYILRQRRTPSIRFQERLVHIQKQRFAVERGKETINPYTVVSDSVGVKLADNHSPARWKRETQILSVLQKWTSWACPPFACVRIVDYAYPAQRQSRGSKSTSGANSGLQICNWRHDMWNVTVCFCDHGVC